MINIKELETLKIEYEGNDYRIEAQDNNNPCPKYKKLFLLVGRKATWSGGDPSEGFAALSRAEAKMLKDYIEEWLSHPPERKLREVTSPGGFYTYRVANADRPLEERRLEYRGRLHSCEWKKVQSIAPEIAVLLVELLNNPYEGE